MNMNRLVSCAALTFGFAASGCMAGEAETPIDSQLAVPFETLSTGDPEDPSPGSLNGFNPNCFWNHSIQQTYRDLAGGALVNAQGELPGMSRLPMDTCRDEALRYLARCVLPTGTSMSDPATGNTYNGWLGVASSWQTQALTTTQQEWVTSCLLQHINGFNLSIPILLEAQLDGFTQSATLQSKYTFEDSIVWGNLFSSTTTLDPVSGTWPAFNASACYSNGPLDTCFDETLTSGALHDRLCGQSGLCGVSLQGNCSNACEWQSLPGAPSYWSCGNTKSFHRRQKDDTMYSTTVCKP